MKQQLPNRFESTCNALVFSNEPKQKETEQGGDGDAEEAV